MRLVAITVSVKSLRGLLHEYIARISVVTCALCRFDKGWVELDESRVSGGVLRVTCQAPRRHWLRLRAGGGLENEVVRPSAAARILDMCLPEGDVGLKSSIPV
jgi:hypothetical protein